ncbi:MAG TPA: hypothetical protein VML95_07605, partial [Longimicrobiales bacterium]|nr:hypothetical protein [Longimicrobiales bacterium]
LPLVVLGVWALWIRVDQYGWTEFRYVRLAALAGLASLAVTGIARRLTARPPILREIPLALSLLLLMAATGPWGAPATALRSQTARLAELAPAAEAAAPDGAANARGPVEAETDAAEVVRYVRDHFGEDALEGAVPAALLARLDSLNLLWGGRSPGEGAQRIQVYATIDNDAGALVPAGTLYRFTGHRGLPSRRPAADAVAYAAGLEVRIDAAGRELLLPLGELAAFMVADARTRGLGGGEQDEPGRRPTRSTSFQVDLSPPRNVIRVEGEDGTNAGVVILENLTLEVPPDGSLDGASFPNMSGLLVVAEAAPAPGTAEAGR